MRQRTPGSDGDRVLRVAVLIGSSLQWREQVMRGIASYANGLTEAAGKGQQVRRRWHVYSAPETAESSVFFSDRYRWDGLIVRPPSERFVRRIVSFGVPAVSVGSVRIRSLKLPRVRVDDEELMKAAATHLISGGLRRFAYCGQFTKNAEDRGPAFARIVREMGHPCEFFSDFTGVTAGETWQRRQRRLVRWIKQLEYPVGVATWNPDVACQVVEACHIAGVRVPGDLAIVTADDDPLKCELASPTVSAIPIPAARIGYEAAALLDDLMNGKDPPPDAIRVRPAGVVTVRQSSATVGAAADRDVHQAVQFIRAHVSEPIGVDDVARAVLVSRRSLERHFARLLGRTPNEEILRTRIEEAKRLLLETDWPAARVASAAGFSSPSYLNYCLRRESGVTPLQFRQRLRLGR